MIAFFPDTIGKAEGVEDFKGAALKAVGLTGEDLGAAFVDCVQ